MLTLRASWFSRSLSSLRATWSRAVTVVGSAFRRAPPTSGVTVGTVARKLSAESELEAIALSPAVYAAAKANALRMTTFPIRVFAGSPMGGERGGDPVSSSVPWVRAFLTLCAYPDPDTRDTLAPKAGESLIAQIVVDLDATGDFFVVPVLTGEVPLESDIIGLRRLHPRQCTIDADETLVYAVPGSSLKWRYPLGTYFHGHLPSWQASGQGLMGTGAGAALAPLVDAERTALQQTASKIDQGGADIRVIAKSAAGAAYLKNPENRAEVAHQLTDELRGKDGRRVFVTGGDIDVEEAGFKPTDLQAPELLDKAPRIAMMAMGCVPAALGMDASNYANGVLQWRAQADADEGKAGVIEAALLRPVARHFARRARARFWQDITARIDLSSHIGYAYVRTDALNRVHAWMRAGWTAEQAAALENLDVPRPAGEVMLTGQAATPGPDPGSTLDQPRRPVGDQGDPAMADTKAPMRSFRALFAREPLIPEAK